MRQSCALRRLYSNLRGNGSRKRQECQSVPRIFAWNSRRLGYQRVQRRDDGFTAGVQKPPHVTTPLAGEEAELVLQAHHVTRAVVGHFRGQAVCVRAVVRSPIGSLKWTQERRACSGRVSHPSERLQSRLKSPPTAFHNRPSRGLRPGVPWSALPYGILHGLSRPCWARGKSRGPPAGVGRRRWGRARGAGAQCRLNLWGSDSPKLASLGIVLRFWVFRVLIPRSLLRGRSLHVQRMQQGGKLGARASTHLVGARKVSVKL